MPGVDLWRESRFSCTGANCCRSYRALEWDTLLGSVGVGRVPLPKQALKLLQVNKIKRYVFTNHVTSRDNWH